MRKTKRERRAEKYRGTKQNHEVMVNEAGNGDQDEVPATSADPTPSVDRDMGLQVEAPGTSADPTPSVGRDMELQVESLRNCGDFGREQARDLTLQHALARVVEVNGVLVEGKSKEIYPHFILRGDLLYRVLKEEGYEIEQLLVPQAFRKKVLEFAHSHLLGGHLGTEKTQERILRRFFWPGVYEEVKKFCTSCPECQLTSPRPRLKAPLVPLPVIETPFDRIAMDLVGPLEKTAKGNQYILVVLDYATRYPEAIPLRNTASKTIAKELVQIFTRVGIPKEILTDQGTPFVSRLMKELCLLLKIKTLRTSVYHPQTDGLVERFNRTLKNMLRKVVSRDGKNWDVLLPYLLFAIREVPQASVGFSPFELLYGRHPRGLLDIAKEEWEEQKVPGKNVIDYVEQMQERIRQVAPIVKHFLEDAQQKQQILYNKQATVRVFQPGDRVMVLVPTAESKLLSQWQGPYEVINQVGLVNYKVRQPGRRKVEQVYHVNLLKPWNTRDALVVYGTPRGDVVPTPEVKMSTDLTPEQQREVREMLKRNADIFSTIPGRTNAIVHEIVTEPGKIAKSRPYRVPEAKREAIKAEVAKMLELGVIEESHSQWSSPIVLVPKPDGSIRFCNDFRRVNECSKFDAYPLPRVDELVEKLAPARFLSCLDLTKGYWQIPLSQSAKEKTAFVTPEGLFQYTVLPFGLHGAPATFQRLMNRLLRPHTAYASAYLDDLVIYSQDWESHLPKLEAVLETLRAAGLTVNPSKCVLACPEVKYLGYTVGRGMVKPQINKIAAIETWPRPMRKKQVRAFLGIVGYYRRFIPHFATRAAPLTELTRARGPDVVQWSKEAETAFADLRTTLCSSPVLIAPDFTKPFFLQTDASEVGLGAVLSQYVGDEEHPVLYLSRKLLPRERKYAVVEKECLAIKWAVESLRYYLLGRTFTLVTDHAPLQWMQWNKEKNAKVTRWFLSLQPYRFVVTHRAGLLHANADALSRVHSLCVLAAPPYGVTLGGRICGRVSEHRYISPRMELAVFPD